MTYYLKPNADIEGFEANIWAYAVLINALDVLDADMTEFTIFNDGEEISQKAAEGWGRLLQEKKHLLKAVNVLSKNGLERTVMVLRTMNNDEINDIVSQYVDEKAKVLSIEEPEPELMKLIDRFADFLINCKGFRQY
ncbi:MAG: hypothetical protein HPY73_02805 [Methanomassiliicoccales archaeon]|nr:MAG: hypothetical protein HPY73_02805 [Methanomassiliicoccales archaeon]